MMRVSAGLAAGALTLLFALAACARDAPSRQGLEDAIPLLFNQISLSANNPDEQRVGELVYRGGLEISSTDARFGGWSGLLVSGDGSHMLSQSDEAHWLKARLLYDARGDLVGIADGQLGDMRDQSGKPMGKAHGDAEGLAALTSRGPDGAVAVSFETDNRVWRYDLSSSLAARPEPIAMPKAIARLEDNLGLEGLTRLRPGVLLAVAESRQMGQGMPAWIVPVGENGAAPARLNVEPHSPYQISDAAMGPSGRHLYLLERHYFGLLGGIVIGVRRIDAETVKPGAVLGGTEIARFNMRENIDNMEGLALRRGADGRTRLYLISDDNYNHPMQRTLLLMFEIAPPQ